MYIWESQGRCLGLRVDQYMSVMLLHVKVNFEITGCITWLREQTRIELVANEYCKMCTSGLTCRMCVVFKIKFIYRGNCCSVLFITSAAWLFVSQCPQLAGPYAIFDGPCKVVLPLDQVLLFCGFSGSDFWTGNLYKWHEYKMKHWYIWSRDHLL